MVNILKLIQYNMLSYRITCPITIVPVNLPLPYIAGVCVRMQCFLCLCEY